MLAQRVGANSAYALEGKGDGSKLTADEKARLAKAGQHVRLAYNHQPVVPLNVTDAGAGNKKRFGIDLKVYRPQIGIAWMEARFGKLWENGIDGLQRYNQLRKVEPMQRALRELGVRSWFAGLRRSQSASRANIEFLELRDGRWKLHPIADWDDIDVATYALQHDLPEHPLSRQGYVSVGDVHTTAPLRDGDAAKTRFFGLTRECGLHFDTQDSVAA